MKSASLEGKRSYYEWTQRELDWYEAESRFLFVAEDEFELQKWLVVVDWLMQQAGAK